MKRYVRSIDYSRYAGLAVTVEDKILTLTMDNADAMNAFTPEMHLAMSQIWDDINDDPEVNVIVVTGAGKAFSAGGNLVTMQEKIDDPRYWDETTAPEAKRIVHRMLECNKPVIARVNGHAAGLGATIALLCDIIVMSRKAKIGDSHVKAGLVAGDGGQLLWPQMVGFMRAREYLFLGDLIPADEAYRIGLVNRVVEPEDLDDTVYDLARRLAAGAQKSIRWTKQVMNQPLRQMAITQMDLALSLETQSNLSKDHQEAVRAFGQKRPPVFTGE